MKRIVFGVARCERQGNGREQFHHDHRAVLCEVEQQQEILDECVAATQFIVVVTLLPIFGCFEVFQ
jgi:hypothetical protein